jgi:tRNA(fMet)-specific endonuclease VapC
VSIENSKLTSEKLLVLDTDHFSEWERDSAAAQRFRVRLEALTPDMAVSIVSVEEKVRGWLAEIGRHPDPHRQISPYAKLQRQIEVFADWVILPWDAETADLFTSFRKQGVRIGSLDLKIACITLAHDATLLTRNARDFSHVPGLRVENWLD